MKPSADKPSAGEATMQTAALPASGRRGWLAQFAAARPARLQGNPDMQGIIRNTSWLLADRVFRMVVGVSLGVAIARHLGPGQYGLMTYAIAFASVFTAVATFGLEGVTVRELTVNPAGKGIILGSAAALRSVTGFLAFAIALVAAASFSPADIDAMPLIGILAAAVLFQPLDVVDYWFQSRTEARYVVLARASAFVVTSLVKIALLLAGAGVYAFAWATLAEAVAAAVGLALVFRLTGNRFGTLSFSLAKARLLLRESWPLAASGLFVLFTMQLDKIILGQMAGPVEVGLYSVAAQMSSIWYLVPTILGSSLAPTLARKHADPASDYLRTLRKVYGLLSLVAVATAIAVTAVATPVVSLLFGKDYLAAAPVLCVHVWTAVFVFHVSIRTRALIAEGRQHYVSILAALTLLASIALNVWLAPLHGAMGAAVASLIAWMLCAAVFPWFLAQTRPSAVMFFQSLIPLRRR